MRLRTRIFLPLLLLLAVGLSACGEGDGPSGVLTEAVTPVTVQLKWTHQTQFAGFYAADQNGYYADEGLEVSLVEGGVDVDLLGPALDGTAQFGIAGADALILARAEGDPVRAIATIYRHNPEVFFALADSGITRLEDFVGNTVRVTSQSAPTLHAMMANAGLPLDQHTEVVLPNELEVFFSGEAPVWAGYVNGFVLTLQEAGYELNIIYPDDYGVHFYADTIFATDDFIAANPELVARFLRATLQGWKYAVENPDAMGPMVLEYDPDADPALETEKMTASLPLVNTGEDYIGWMKPEVWEGMEEILREQGVVTAPLDVTEVYTMDSLEDIYGSGQ